MAIPSGGQNLAGGVATQAAALLKEHFETPFTDGMNRSNVLFQRFKRAQGVGKEVQWKIHYSGNSSAGSYGETDNSATAGVQSVLEARSPFKLNQVVYQVTGLVEAATSGQGGFMQALAFEARESLPDLQNAINNQLLSFSAPGNSSKDIDGLGYIVSDTGTYATIDRSTYTWHQSYVKANGGTSRNLTLALMQDQMVELEKPARNAKVSAVMCNRKHYNDYGNLLLAQRRYVNTMSLDGGVQTLEYEGIPVIPVPNMATGRMFFLDESEWFYYVLKNFDTVELAVDGDARRFMTTHYSQLVCKYPGRQGSINDLA